MVERSLSMREVPGSIPGFSKHKFFSLTNYHVFIFNSVCFYFYLLCKAFFYNCITYYIIFLFQLTGGEVVWLLLELL